MKDATGVSMEISRWVRQGRAFQVEGTAWGQFGATDNVKMWKTIDMGLGWRQGHR